MDARPRLRTQLTRARCPQVSNTKFKVEQLAQNNASRAALDAESAKLREQQRGLEGMFRSCASLRTPPCACFANALR